MNKNFSTMGVAITLCFVFCQLLPFTTHSQTLKDEWVVCNTAGCKLLDPYFSDGVTIKWEGPCQNGKAHGFGKLTKYKNGEYESTYEGEYKDGIREGKGTFTHKDGSIAKGNFVDGQLTGYGTRGSEDDGRYEGEFLNYRYHGKGTYYYANGSKFEGFFVSDRVYTGKFTNYDGKVSYFQSSRPVDKITQEESSYKPEIGIKLTEYFDNDWKRCKPKNAAYYRLVTYQSPNKPAGVVKDYYITGELQSEFTCPYLDYEDEGKNFHEGTSTWYYKNGQIQQIRHYFNNNINGTNTYYYEDGQKSAELEYSYGVLNGKVLQWYKNGKTKLFAIHNNGELTENKYIEFDETGAAALVYIENFTKNKEIWTPKESSFETIIDDNNKLNLKLKTNQSIGLNNYIDIGQDVDYSIECAVQKKSGKVNDGFGMLFGFKDWNNYYSFIISESGSFKVYGKFEGMDLVMKDWTQSSTIRKNNQLNMLKVFKFDDEFIFSINGQVVERMSSRSLRGNYHGLSVYGAGEYQLSNLTVKEFISAEHASRIVDNMSQPEVEWAGNGSGFFINEKGYIATNYHVIEDAKAIQIEYNQKGEKLAYSAEIVVSDKQNDLAIIRIKDPAFKSLPPIPYVFTTNIKDVGSDVFALGYPIANVMGDEIKFTDGKISSKTGIEGDVTVYQISVPIQPGNSGGPLFDNNGNLVGITSARLNKEHYGSENVNYAIKSTYLKNLVDVMPTKITLPLNYDIQKKPLTEKIKLLSEFIPIIKVK